MDASGNGRVVVRIPLTNLQPGSVGWQDGSLWFSWTAPRSAAGENPNYPQPYTRVVRINTSTWKTASELQVWNPGYVFTYSAVAELEQ
ncbi:hypothetical protein QFZ65_003236 [Arthrobacter sp. B3I9]|uniref:hypothetical protein n=1 Tax=Arthrobacter sp. B3I9 TaxID=3042270 RepID=UPI002794E3A9|nr:hypothetical protein [Arthrobacter sp. B3I9]MDQ0851298.1 hypothetical protein [Arthrobacter sp. B3I9]